MRRENTPSLYRQLEEIRVQIARWKGHPKDVISLVVDVSESREAFVKDFQRFSNFNS